MSKRPLRRGLPRSVELGAAVAGLAISAPFLATIAALVKLSSPGPVLFKQARVGQGGRTFDLYKFRTMRTDGSGPAVTVSGDSRITRFGKLLRFSKLDELPELWNILRGDMAIIGPRPEVPAYVDLDDPLWKEVLSVPPGLTDPMSIRLRSEESVLASVTSEREYFYRTVLLRYKLLGSAKYLRERTWKSDVRVLLETLMAVVFPPSPPSVDEITQDAAARPPV